MLNKTAAKITDVLLSHQVISGEQYDIYVYGFELLISFLFSTMLILIAGIIFHAFIRTLAFLIVFIILRSFTGGFHAKTYLVCNVCTLSTYGAVMLLSTYVKVNLIAYAILFVLGFIVLFIFSPVENPNKPLSTQQKKKHKTTGMSLYMMKLLITIITHLIS